MDVNGLGLGPIPDPGVTRHKALDQVFEDLSLDHHATLDQFLDRT